MLAAMRQARTNRLRQSHAGVWNSLAARLRILERGHRGSAEVRDDLASEIIFTARRIHDLIDQTCRQHTHSLPAAIRLAERNMMISSGLARRLHRVATAANALRHTTRFALDTLMEDMLTELGTGAVDSSSRSDYLCSEADSLLAWRSSHAPALTCS
mmetsp:Transcript_23062/g.66865  ORF Transcript_23062/g.66865 Transcript_23062/m.66865 type:complete len:157 (-) Transcript_23062:399-869(-)